MSSAGLKIPWRTRQNEFFREKRRELEKSGSWKKNETLKFGIWVVDGGRIHAVACCQVKKVYAADTKEDYSTMDFEGKMWKVVSGECTMDSTNCLLSPGFPEAYGDSQQCKVAINPDGALPLNVMNFTTELGFDKLYVDCKSYSGSTGPQGVIPIASLFWTSDASVTESGWRICPSTRL